MRTYLAMFAVVILCAASVAQERGEIKRVEVFTGFQFVHVYPAENGKGWDLGVTTNLTRSFGFTGDFSGAYEHGSQLYTYLVGPRLAARGKRFTPFVHALFGGAHADGISAFSMAVGGGLDVNAGEH